MLATEFLKNRTATYQSHNSAGFFQRIYGSLMHDVDRRYSIHRHNNVVRSAKQVNNADENQIHSTALIGSWGTGIRVLMRGMATLPKVTRSN